MTRTLTLLLALAAFLSGAHAQDAQRGSTKVQMCIGCHGIVGYQASFPEIHKVPMIAGQNAKYIVSALQAYAKGDRKHPTMRGIAGSLSEQDMNDVAAFYEQQAKLPAVADSIPAATSASRRGTNRNTPPRITRAAKPLNALMY
jgi:cytochrome c553